jgi:excisionase family DNA binding protein
VIKLYNVSEVAEMLGLSTSCVYKKAERGEIQAIKIGTVLRFSEENIQNFLNKCKMPQLPAVNREIDYDSLDNQRLV